MMFIYDVICAEKDSNDMFVKNHFFISELNFLNIQIVTAVMLTFICILFIMTLL